MLSELPHAHDFAVLGRAVQACVARREQELGDEPPSEPQMDVGAKLRPLLRLSTLFAASGWAADRGRMLRLTREHSNNQLPPTRRGWPMRSILRVALAVACSPGAGG